MIRSAKFWVPMTLFQLVFGLTVFAITRQYYIHEPDKVSANPTAIKQPALEWPEQSKGTGLEQLISSYPGQSIIKDPVEISRQADEFFSNGQYQRAAELYEQLLATGSNDVNTYNNLGITLHYLYRSTEAIRILNDGLAIDPNYPRIWLTLGFVNSQLGNTEQARSALTTAAEMGAGTNVGQSATKMLNELGSTK
jgi:predicted Zn-dependent protease